ncbi:MAG: bifunctional diaminohydroxyphosphoribosylaminopyrimidine deaminase/5-amino-6-(5-phosphoribosylamino)uracil reductase RibD [Chloroflexi bacterium]|nr:bifunctional diaminohydroxyphosphoribosylaminopyrimidine deaminase/5-amino-6-(5-phosphoribosylamino)uracil reductase RibD [Chloroflexota bacterium]
MERALSLARQALGNTSPNPPVGAVVVNNGVVVGEGYTRRPGEAHAEIVALEKAGERARGSTLYVTLEPCCHFGRTPPCTHALIAAGVAEVHIAIMDPNPLVSGKGKSELEESGVKTFLGEGRKKAQELYESHFKWITTGTPFVIAKFAMSLDGKIATRTGDSRWISGEKAREYVHELRRTSDAVVVGANTVLIDDPKLTARDREDRPLPVQPLRVIVDSNGQTSPKAEVFREPGATLVATTEDITPEKLKALTKAGAEVLILPRKKGLVNLKKLTRILGQRQVTSLLVEGGGTLLGSFFQERLVDKVIAFVSTVIIGGKSSPTPVMSKGAGKMADALRLHRVKITRLGNDALITGYTKGGGR